MFKCFLSILVFLAIAGCDNRRVTDTGKWLIESSTSKNTVFTKGAIVELKPDNVQFTMEGKKTSYPSIISSNRLLVNVGNTKWLFGLEALADEIILTELYKPNPLIIRLKRQQ